MTKTYRIALLSAAATGTFAAAAPAHAQAFYLQEQSARGAGRAFSGEVADTGPASLWWNPASIADVDSVQTVLNASLVLPSGKVVDKGTLIRRPAQTFVPVGGNSVSKDPINTGVVPSGGVAIPLGRGAAFGLAISAPYNFTTDYEANSWARYSADKTRLRTIDIQPSLAISLTDWLRVGGGANIEYADAYLSNKLPNVLASMADGDQVLKGNGWNVGWSAGVQLHNSWATVGISYKSRIKHTLTGSLTVSGLVGPLAAGNMTVNDAHASFYTPAQIIVGGRFKLDPAVTLNMQVVRSTWADFDAIRLGAPINQAVPENYRNTFTLAGGFDFALSPKATLRAGVQRGITPTQDGNRDARVPDSNRWNYAVGGSYQVNPHLALDLAANYISFENETIDRATAAAGSVILTNGATQDASAVVLSAGARMSF